MQPAFSAELRWFWRNDLPADVEAWFRTRAGEAPAGGGSARTDVYALEPQPILGIKERGTQRGAEIKGLIRSGPNVTVARLSGRIQIWGKWISHELRVDRGRTVTTRKTRWLRKFAMTSGKLAEVPLGPDERPKDGRPLPPDGCNLELTEVRTSVDDIVWWTLGFEAFGGLEHVQETLTTAMQALSSTDPPQLSGAVESSYPEWLQTLDASASHPS